MIKALTRSTLIAAAAVAVTAAPAGAATALCVPKTAGQTAFSGGDNPSVYCDGAKTMLMPDSVGDQQKLIDLLPYITFKASGVGKKPTLLFTGMNIQIIKKEWPGYGNTDGTGNLIIGDSGMKYSDQSVNDWRYSGSENLIMGSANEWRGRASLIVGEGNKVGSTLSFVHGQNNTLAAGLQHFVTGNSQNVTENYKVIADGAGKDVKWVRYDATGKVVASSEPQTGDAYYYASSSYSFTKFNGVDSANCALSAQVEGPDSQVTSTVVTPYSGYIWARFNKAGASGGSNTALSVPHTVTAICNKNR
jgi:hypothetical protein